MRIVFLFCCMVTCGFSHISCSEDGLSYVVINAETGKILSQQGAHKKQYPASTTKIALVAYILNASTIDLDQKLVVPFEAVRTVSPSEKAREKFSKYPSYILESDGSIAGFQAGEVISLRDALYGTLLPSGDDAANMLAYYWGNGSIPACVDKMNALAASLGCQNTHFMNPHGLHHPQHYSTAYDLAILASYALKNPLFKKIVSTPSYEKAKTNKQPATTWATTNKLIRQGPLFCARATGVKTGWHSRAQHCLVASGENGDRSIVVVLLHCSDRKELFLITKKLLDRFLNEQKKERQIVSRGKIPLERELEGDVAALPLRAEEAVFLSYYPSEEPAVRAIVEWQELSYPIKKGQQVGVLKVFSDDKEMAHIPLYADENRAATWKLRYLETQRFLQSHKAIVLVIFGSLILGVCLFLKGRRR